MNRWKTIFYWVVIILLLTITYVVTNHKPAPIERLVEIKQQLKKNPLKDCMADEVCRVLTEAAYYEARSESDKGVAAVMHTVLNRAAHPTRWGNTPGDVVAEKHQFSYRHDGSMGKGFTEKDQYRRISIIARKVLDGEIESPVGRAVYYHSTDIEPPEWARRKKYVTRYGKHLFYSERS